MADRSPLTRTEASRYLNISKATLDRRRKDGLIPDLPLGGRVVRFNRDDLDQFRRAGYPAAGRPLSPADQKTAASLAASLAGDMCGGLPDAGLVVTLPVAEQLVLRAREARRGGKAERRYKRVCADVRELLRAADGAAAATAGGG